MHSDEFYEKQASLNECHTCLENAIDCLKPFMNLKMKLIT